MVIAETPRLRVRHFVASDRAAMKSVFTDADVMRFSMGVRTPEWVDNWVQENMVAREGGISAFAVVLNETRETIGYCGLFRYPDVDGQPEIEMGYRLARAYWGKGYATEAARAVRNHSFGELSLPRLIALIDPHNTASIQVARKLGFAYEKDAMMPGYDHPDHVYHCTPAMALNHDRYGRT